MKTVLPWLLLGILPAAGQTDGGHVAPFALYMTFEHEPPQPVARSIKEELTSIMSAVGLTLEWRSWESARGYSSWGLAVVRFKGRCDLVSLVPEPVEFGPLGWTYVTDGKIIPFTDIDCDRGRAFLSKSLLHLPAEARDSSFGRSLARVLAHELYHIITETRHHGASGVAESSFKPSELLAGNFSFSEADQRVLWGRAAVQQGHASGKGLIAAGGSLFTTMGCAHCHGSRGQGAHRVPAIRAGGIVSLSELASRLTSHSSRMYRDAQSHGTSWRPLADSELEQLVNYLNAALD